MRNMSFSKTIPQMRARTKTVTRRKAWNNLKPGEHIRAVEKSMGLKAGEKVVPIAEIEIISIWREPIYCVDDKDIALEGFPGMNRGDFISLLCDVMKCEATDECNRIEFRFVDALLAKDGE